MDDKTDISKTNDMARAAWLYYSEELTQSQVAKCLGVSRSTVIRLLNRAKESGLVQISLGVSSETFKAEIELQKAYGLQKVRIVPEAFDEQMQRRWLGQAAAETLVELSRPDYTIALSWGSTLQFMADSLRGEGDVSGMKIVSMIGGLHNASRGTNPYEVAEQVAQYFGARPKALYAPVYVKNATTANGLWSDPGLIEAMDLARHASLAVFSVGALNDDATLVKLGYINEDEKSHLNERGTVGDIACRWIDAAGNPVDFPPSIHPIGLSLEELKNIPRRLAVAGGESKFEVIRAALSGHYITHLVTDVRTAMRLLECDSTRVAKP